jgi:hypothetical protein
VEEEDFELLERSVQGSDLNEELSWGIVLNCQRNLEKSERCLHGKTSDFKQ